jgi:hypothetical protein
LIFTTINTYSFLPSPISKEQPVFPTLQARTFLSWTPFSSSSYKIIPTLQDYLSLSCRSLPKKSIPLSPVYHNISWKQLVSDLSDHTWLAK